MNVIMLWWLVLTGEIFDIDLTGKETLEEL